MKVVVDKEVLSKGIQTIQNIISGRSTLPILSNILFEAGDDQIKLSGTDLEIAITTTIPAKVEEKGTTTIPAKRFGDLIRKLPNEPVELNVKKNHACTIDYGRGKCKMMGLPPEEFPKLPTVSKENPLELPQSTLLEMLTLTSFAISKDETRYILNGVYFSTEGGKLRLVATDGRRLAMMDRPTNANGGTKKLEAIIPTKAIVELQRLLEESGTVKVWFTENQVRFEIGSTVMVARTIEGEYPNYQQVVPPEVPEKVRLNREELLQSLERVSLWTTTESQAVKFNVGKNQLVVSKQTAEGEADDKIGAEYKGKDVEVGFNPTYLSDVLKHLPQDTLDMELPAADRAGVIRTKDQYVYIVLPMQLT